ncbi:MAG: glycosyltransferase family 39 protein [Candidatus Omnitrophota bacterium]|nr:glycosyltransferase family 39 protein [Candidatus Omnitrophota bacterium]
MIETMLKNNPIYSKGKARGELLALFGIIFVAIIVRVGCFLYYQANSEIQIFEYELVAENMILGKGFMYETLNTVQRAGVAPLYPALCALAYILFGHHHALTIILQIAFSAATCVVLFFLAKRFCDLKCAYLATTFAALHPASIVYSSTKLHPIAFYSFLICSSVLLLVICSDDCKIRYKVLLGLCTGFCVLERAMFLPFFILAWFWLYFFSRNREEAKKIILISIVSVVIIVSPWVVRNTIVFKRPVFIQSNQWWGFWLGNNPQSSGTATVALGMSGVEASPEAFRQKLLSLDEAGQTDLFRATAFDYIRQYPYRFIGRTAKKFYYFWWFSPQSGLRYPASYLKWYRMYYSIILPVSIIGIVLAMGISKYRPIAVLMLLLFSSYSLLHSFYFIDGRHRCSIEQLLLVCFSFGVFQILSRLHILRPKSVQEHKL